jgi:hypothetical protein
VRILDGMNNIDKNVKVIGDIEKSNVMQHLTHSNSDGQMTNLPWLSILLFQHKQLFFIYKRRATTMLKQP